MNIKTLYFVFICLFAAYVPITGNPVKMKPGYYELHLCNRLSEIKWNRDPQNPDKSLAFPDFLIPRAEYPNRPKVCFYKGKEYSDGTVVATDEPCLKCKCLSGSLICYLRVCPALPDPPPPQCVLVLRRGACCSELVCEDGGITTNHISRSEPGETDHPVDSTISFGDGKGCIDNGTLYASGSAMSTSSLCEYCYCISGEQHCVKPKCLLPASGCEPTRSPHSCCPVSYTCRNQTSTTTTISSLHSRSGCMKDNVFHPEGERVSSAESPCTNCFCIRSKVKCASLSCAPPLQGCKPIIMPGQCCASSYNCSKMGTNDSSTGKNVIKHLMQVNYNSGNEQDMIINERSFPGDTLLTPSQIAEILLGAERRSTRYDTAEREKADKKNSDISVQIVTDTGDESVTNVSNKKSNSSHSLDAETTMLTFLLSTEKTNTENIAKSTSTTELNHPNRGNIKKEDNSYKPNILLKNKIDNNNDTSPVKIKIDLESPVQNDNSDNIVPNDDDYISVSTVIIHDSVNCTTEITSVDYNNSTESRALESTTQIIETYNDTQGRRPITSEQIESDESLEENDTESDISVGSQFPSHSLIIPKNNDVFMVNVSTFVRTNTSVVTLRPVAAIPPEIEAILNMSRKNQSDDYLDYDYKSALPPSLPNLEIIPFLATDAVVNDKKTDKKKISSKYDNVYPSIESKHYLSGTRDQYSTTVNSYVAPTTYPSYLGSNYNRNPVYKQHINDKFQANTYSPSKFNNQAFAQEKYDDIPLKEAETESSEFNIDRMNLFSPPLKTEGGFLPRDPPLDPYYDVGFSSTGEGSYSATDSSLMVTNHAKITGDNCLSNGREYKNGELITEPHACVVCFCYYGDIHCQDPECPPIKPGCKRIIEIGSSSCCGIEICNDETFEKNKEAAFEKVNKNTNEIKSTTQRDMIVETTTSSISPTSEVKYNPLKTVSITQTPEEDSTTGVISTFVVPSKLHKVTTTEAPTSSTSTTISTISTEDILSYTKVNSIDLDKSTRSDDVNLESKLPEEKLVHKVVASKEEVPVSVTENEIIFQETLADNYESDPFAEDVDDDEGFNFDSVLKYLLGEDTTTRPPPRSTTTRPSPRFTTTRPPPRSSTTKSPPRSTTKLFATTPKSTYSMNTPTKRIVPETRSTVYTFINTSSFTSTNRPSLGIDRSTIFTAKPLLLKVTPSLIPFKIMASTSSSVSPVYKNVPKLTFTNLYRNTSATTVPYKEFTKLKFSTKSPIIYSTPNRFTKLKFSPTPFPLTTEPMKKIAPPSYPRDHYQQISKRKESSTDSSLPFGAGLLKLAGCNIYGRMYRVGKIISELSGPCLECMCTEVGVQCKSVPNSNC